jgi:hypothetical protein
MIAVTLDRETSGPQDLGESGAEISIGEEDTGQAARS